MHNLNRVEIIGCAGRDPEVRSFPNGGKVVNLRIATTESWNDRNTGERRENTEWHSVAIFGDGLTRIAEQYIRKGSLLRIVGKLVTRKWQDQSGADRYATEIHVTGQRGEIGLLDRKSSGPGRSGEGAGSDQSSGPASGDTPGNRSRFDDDIPF